MGCQWCFPREMHRGSRGSSTHPASRVLPRLLAAKCTPGEFPESSGLWLCQPGRNEILEKALVLLAISCLALSSTWTTKLCCRTFSPKHSFTSPPVTSLSFSRYVPVTPTSSHPSAQWPPDKFAYHSFLGNGFISAVSLQRRTTTTFSFLLP